FLEVILEGPDGDMPTWVVSGSDDTWVVFVHDFGADRTESLRVLPELHRLGLPVVVPALDGAEVAARDRSDLGTERWRAVAVAVDFALGSGATDVVLFGSGAGASAVLLATDEGRYDRVTAALVLDAPLLDPAADTDRRLAADRVPGFLIGWAKAMATFRYGVDWTRLDHVARAVHQDRPILVIHGDRDVRFGLESSRAFVEAARDATLVVVAGAGSGEAWNLDPESYEAALSDFLEETVVGRRQDPAG
ncbi:MAG TPA: alpha/beta hydrolase, partial [Acidimicrobiia bacterium]|nr:alpha/beta hydrolase [Acidimicrobiia bacterium]